MADEGCSALYGCDTCVRQDSCAWCAETNSCGRRGDNCCADKWTLECPERTIACYTNRSQSSCAGCTQSELCAWCDTRGDDSCSGKRSFCTFASDGRQGRSLACKNPVRAAARCPAPEQRSTELDSGLLVGLIVAALMLIICACCAPRLRAQLRGTCLDPDTRRARRRLEVDARREAAIREVVVQRRATTLLGLPLMLVGASTKAGECAICLDEWALGEQLITLPCLHLFHKHCAERWLLEPSSGGQCPVCKQPMVF